MKTLIIAEKPDMGRSIAAAIDPKAANKRTHLEGERYIITWAIGHLIGLAEPDAYDAKYKRWSLDHLPILPRDFKLVPNPRTRDQLNVIDELARRCDRLVNACDAGREGQYIFHLIQTFLRLKQPVSRLWISDLTPETIRAGFAGLKDAAEFENLTKAARARSEADWLIGMNGSRAFTTRHNVLLSVGRVQTPVLALIHDRQKQIEAFDAKTFFEVAGLFRQDDTLYKGVWQGGRVDARETAEAVAAKTAGQPGRIAGYDIKEAREYPFKLYDLTLLQREANAKCGFSAKKTLDVAQALYERHKVITYPRTNSNYVTEANIPEMHRALANLRGTAYDELAAGANRSLVHARNAAICNPAKVEDHHAILPTHKKPGRLSPDEEKIYDLIVRRFLSQFYPPASYKVHTVVTEVCGETFKTTVKELLEAGWKTVYAGGEAERRKRGGSREESEADEEEETVVPFVLDAARPVLCEQAEVKEKQTKPPKPYTEGTLLKAMESAGKQIEDEELREAMKDAGLGTPATRAATIERLKQVGYIGMKGRQIVLEPKGRTAVEVFRAAGVEVLTSPELTGAWEKRLNDISKGSASEEEFLENIRKFAAQLVDKVRRQARAERSAFGAGESGGGRKRKGGRSAARKEAGTAAEGANRSRPARPTATGDATGKKTAPGTVIGACPRPGCGGRIFMGRKGYGCSRYKEGCSFVIWKTSFGKTLSDAAVRALLERGRTNKLKLGGGDGGSYEARIVLADPHTGALEIERADQ